MGFCRSQVRVPLVCSFVLFLKAKGNLFSKGNFTVIPMEAIHVG